MLQTRNHTTHEIRDPHSDHLWGGAPQKMNDFMEEQRQFPGQNVTKNQRNNNQHLYKFSFTSIMLNIQVYVQLQLRGTIRAVLGHKQTDFVQKKKSTLLKRPSVQIPSGGSFGKS